MSIVKWAGGKSWLDLPETTRTSTWIEPFAGGAAQFLKRAPARAILCDKNAHLINMYKQVRERPAQVQAMVPERVATRSEFEAWRRMHNHGDLPAAERAAVFLTLNRSCFNGLWRENKDGEFNVPWCKNPKRVIRQDLTEASAMLKNARLLCGDFTMATSEALSGDAVYMDPPYYETFDEYQPGGFSDQDHVRVALEARRLRELGCLVWISYNDHPSIRRLYHDWQIEERSPTRGMSRRREPELLISSG